MTEKLDILINSSAKDLLGKGSQMYMSLKTAILDHCLLYTSPSPRDVEESRMPSSA